MVARKPKKNKVYWTYEEEKQIIEWVAQRRLQDPTGRVYRQARMAQQELFPLERRKRLGGRQALGQPMIDAIEKRTKELRGAVTTVEHVSAAGAPADPLEVYTTAELVAELIDRVTGPLARLDAALARLAVPSIPRSWTAPASPSPVQEMEMRDLTAGQAEPPRPPRGPCISIVGYLEGQQRSIRDNLNTEGVVADVRFVDKDQADTRFPTTTEFIIVEKHSNHRWFETAGKLVGNRKRFFVHGVSGAVRIIKRIVEGRTE